MAKTTTRIDLPAPMPRDHGGANAIASRASDGAVRVGVNIDGGVALATATGGEAKASLEPGRIADQSRSAYFRTENDVVTVITAAGARGTIPAALIGPEREDRASWEVVPTGTIVMTPGWPTLNFVRAGSSVWTVGSGAENQPFVSAFAAAADGSEVFVAISAPANGPGSLSARAADGTERWARDLGVRVGRIAVSPDGRELAVLVGSPKRCETCIDAAIVDAGSGKTKRTIELVREHAPLSLTGDSMWVDETMGFSGGLLWFHGWRRERDDDIGRGRLDERCWYSVYDTNSGSGALLRHDTLPCDVRTIVPLADGGVVTVQPEGETTISVNVFDGPP